MKALTNEVSSHFCHCCQWAFVCWKSYCTLFPPDFGEHHIKTPEIARGLHVVNFACQEHYLHEICKLHDPAVQQGQINLGIDYIVRYGGWKSPVQDELAQLQVKLDGFASRLRTARNKILSHNDLENILLESTLGGFPAGEDVKYFENLQVFVNIVHRNTIGGDFVFNRDVEGDAAAIQSLLKL
jgi:HEPN superfamily AbiU2-like protein